MKRTLAILLALVMVISLSACIDRKNNISNTTTTTENLTEPVSVTATEINSTNTPDTPIITDYFDENTDEVKPLLYKVSDDKGNYLWILGTIHVAKDYFYPLPDYIEDAYEAADSLAVECDVKAFETDLDAQQEAMMPLMYLDGSTIKDYISEETYEKAKEVLKDYGQYASYIDYFKPVMWYSLIDSAMIEDTGAQYDLGIDNHFLNDAYDTGKKILEVESVQFQYEMLANFSAELQITLLEDVLYYCDNFDLYKSDAETMMDLWCLGDEKLFGEYLNTDEVFESKEEEELYEEYNKAMVTDRNIGMADFAEEQLAAGEKVFICVGAAHVVGEGAMADLLAERGYNVEIVR